METGTFLLLVLAMGAISLVLAISLVAAIVTVAGWLLKFFLTFFQPSDKGKESKRADRRGWLTPAAEPARG